MTLRTLESTGALPRERGSDVHLVLASRAPEPAAVPLALHGITKRWRANQSPVLDGVSVMLEPGTRTLVGGRNGVGKTTLLRIAAGLIDPERGRAEVWGCTAHENRARYQRLVSFLSAGDRGLYARLSVRHHLNFCARIAMLPRERLSSSVEETIDAFGLRQLAERRVDRISMGQRQRLRIAMTFLPSPEVVLLDEPLTSLDAEGVIILGEASAAVQARGGAVLWCSPEEERIRFDAHFLLEGGRLVPA
jgi:ABC-2 type transport system ATP-binding protein